MTREQRQAELERILKGPNGTGLIVELYQEKVTGHGQMPPVGILVSSLIPKILDAEFGSQQPEK